MLTEIFIVLALFVLNGLFSMSEIAIVSARKVRLEQRAKKGSKGAQIARDLAEDPTRFLSTVQVGITLIGILTGFYTGSVFSDNVTGWLGEKGVPVEYAGPVGITLVVLATTYFSLILGELVPKKIGLLNPEAIASAAALPMYYLSRVSAPVVTLLTASTNFFVRIFGLKASDEEEVSEEEVKSLIAQGASTGTFEKIEQALVERVFQFSDRKVGSIMTHRALVDWIDLNEAEAELKRALAETTHSHMLACRDEIDNVEGVLPLRAAVAVMLREDGMPSVTALLEQPVYVPDSMGVLKAVEKLRDRKNHLAIVVNEFGSIEGIITLTDILQGLLLDLDTPGSAEEGMLVDRGNGSYFVDGALPFADFVSHFELEQSLVEASGFHTMAGFFLDQYKQFPAVGATLTWQNFSFEVADLDGRRIDKLIVTEIEEAS